MTPVEESRLSRLAGFDRSLTSQMANSLSLILVNPVDANLSASPSHTT